MKNNSWKMLALASLLLTGCRGGDEGVSIAQPVLTYASVKSFRVTWKDALNARYYRLLENVDGNSGFVQVGVDVPQGIQRIDHIVPLYKRLNAQYILQTCDESDCKDSGVISVEGNLAESIGNIRGNHTEGDNFSSAIDLSLDGLTMVVGAWGESSGATGINGDETDNSATNSGAVYVFEREGHKWFQQAYIKASNAEAFDKFGGTLSLSGDGNVLAVGAVDEDSMAKGINGDQTDNSALGSGAVYVFTRSGQYWSQQSYLKASNTGAGDGFGVSVSLSDDASTLVVGAYTEESSDTGVNGDEVNNDTDEAGAAYVFAKIGNVWRQQAYLKASNTDQWDNFGIRVSVSADGNTIAVGANGEGSSASGIDGDGTDNSASGSGAVYVYIRNGDIWSQQAYIKASNPESTDEFGGALSLSDSGNVLAVGAMNEYGGTSGIDGDEHDNSAPLSGAAYIFSRSGNTWSQEVYIKGEDPELFDYFGCSVDTNGVGDVVVVGACRDDSNSLGVNGDPRNNADVDSGAAFVFSRKGGVWTQTAFLKANETSPREEFGTAVSVSSDGETIAVGSVLDPMVYLY